MKAYIGSTNKNKVQATKEILEPYGYEVIGLEVDSQVGSQPKNDYETLTGAKNRARALPQDGLRIGLEAGIEMLDNIMYLTNFGVLIDEDDNEYYAGGTRIPLPKEIANLILNENFELSDAMGEYFNTQDIKHKNGAIGYFTFDLVKRVDIFTHIVSLLYGQYLFRKQEEK